MTITSLSNNTDLLPCTAFELKTQGILKPEEWPNPKEGGVATEGGAE